MYFFFFFFSKIRRHGREGGNWISMVPTSRQKLLLLRTDLWQEQR
jgi:hypothetical protein